MDLKKFAGLNENAVMVSLINHAVLNFNAFKKDLEHCVKDLTLAGNAESLWEVLDDPEGENALILKAIQEDVEKSYLNGSSRCGFNITTSKLIGTPLQMLANAVVKSFAKPINEAKKLLDPSDPINDSEIMTLNRELANIMALSESVNNEINKVIGNGLREQLMDTERPQIRIKGSDDGFLKIWVTKHPFDEENTGELILNAPNSAVNEFEVVGRKKGIKGISKLLSGKEHLQFVLDEGHLMAWGTEVVKGQIKFREVELGTLVY